MVKIALKINLLKGYKATKIDFDPKILHNLTNLDLHEDF